MRRIRQTAIVLLAAMFMMSAAAVSEGVVRLPAIQCIEAETFMNDISIQEVMIPDGVELIDFGAFSGCTALKKAVIPSSVLIIDENAFDGCESLVDLTLSEGLGYLYDRAFADCASLREITLPSTLKYIDDNAFEGCDALKTVNAREGTYAYAWAVRNGYIEPEGEFNVYPAVDDGEISAGSSGVTQWRHLNGNGTELYFAVSSKAEWFVSVSYGEDDPEWLEDDYSETVFGASDRSISFLPYLNESDWARSATITFTSGNASKVFVISQEPFLTAGLASPTALVEHGIPEHERWDEDQEDWVSIDWEPPTLPAEDIELVWDVSAGAKTYELCFSSPGGREDCAVLTPNAEGQIVYTIPARQLDPGSEEPHIVQMRLTDSYGHTYYNEEYQFLIADPEKAE